MGKDIQLLDNGVEEYQQTLKYNKKIMSLKSYGIILCFDAYVPKAKDMIDNRFRINLLHDSSEPYYAFGITVLQLTFKFATQKYISLRENNVTFKRGGDSYMEIRTEGSKEYSHMGGPEMRSNPIGQTGVHINVVIYAEEFFYNISINGGDFIHYHHRFPPWAVNHVMV
uniref:Galectin n=1 Tax=Meloidogyne enterolobii TaxID=390850 RepID=A0A6V7XK49_MELEN|nr:unnamed protein product [Meloidogyne enterolobii]